MNSFFIALVVLVAGEFFLSSDAQTTTTCSLCFNSECVDELTCSGSDVCAMALYTKNNVLVKESKCTSQDMCTNFKFLHINDDPNGRVSFYFYSEILNKSYYTIYS